MVLSVDSAQSLNYPLATSIASIRYLVTAESWRLESQGRQAWPFRLTIASCTSPSSVTNMVGPISMRMIPNYHMPLEWHQVSTPVLRLVPQTGPAGIPLLPPPPTHRTVQAVIESSSLRRIRRRNVLLR